MPKPGASPAVSLGWSLENCEELLEGLPQLSTNDRTSLDSLNLTLEEVVVSRHLQAGPLGSLVSSLTSLNSCGQSWQGYTLRAVGVSGIRICPSPLSRGGPVLDVQVRGFNTAEELGPGGSALTKVSPELCPTTWREFSRTLLTYTSHIVFQRGP